MFSAANEAKHYRWGEIYKTPNSGDCKGRRASCKATSSEKWRQQWQRMHPSKRCLSYHASKATSAACAMPCPVLTNFTPNVLRAIENKQLLGIMKTRLLRQAASFYWGLCPRPTHDEYVAMSIALCDKYPQLRDKMPSQGKYWVSSLSNLIL